VPVTQVTAKVTPRLGVLSKPIAAHPIIAPLERNQLGKSRVHLALFRGSAISNITGLKHHGTRLRAFKISLRETTQRFTFFNKMGTILRSLLSKELYSQFECSVTAVRQREIVTSARY
jgi:hypothetical protein